MAITKSKTVDEPLIKKRIRLVITRKKKMLGDISGEEEMLRSELMGIKRLHDTKIGVWYARIDSLDEEIFSLKKLKDLLAKDIPHDEARRLLEARAKAEEEKRDAETKRMEEEYARIIKHTSSERANGIELKRLWRKLAFRFHPDLVQNEAEKKERELMMQKVNDAYSRGDLRALELLEESGEEQIMASDTTLEALQKTLLDIESSIKRVKQKIAALKRSEWYGWKQQIADAKKEKRDVLSDLEKKLKYQAGIREKTIRDLQKELKLS